MTEKKKQQDGSFMRMNARGEHLEFIFTQDPTDIFAWDQIEASATDPLEKDVIKRFRKLGMTSTQWTEAWHYIQQELQAKCFPIIWVFNQPWGNPDNYHIAALFIHDQAADDDEVKSWARQAVQEWLDSTPGSDRKGAPDIQASLITV